MAEEFADAFFDSPGLLGVMRAGGAAAADGLALDPVRRFIRNRRHDARPSSWGAFAPKVIAAGGVLLVMSLTVLPQCTGGSNSNGGWSVRAPRIEHAMATDCTGAEWRLRTASLADDLAPTGVWQLWYARSLPGLPAELERAGAVTDWIVPRCSPDDRLAYHRGEALAAGLMGVDSGRGCALIVDLPGAQSVAAAAGMAQRFAVVFACDSMPHRVGVVPAEETLSALCYWRPRLVAARDARPEGAPPAFVLDGDRLAPYANEVERYDNRSRASLPTAAELHQQGIRRLIYVRETAADAGARDDVADLLVACREAGIQVEHHGLDAFDGDAQAPAEDRGAAYGWFSSGARNQGLARMQQALPSGLASELPASNRDRTIADLRNDLVPPPQSPGTWQAASNGGRTWNGSSSVRDPDHGPSHRSGSWGRSWDGGRSS